MASFYAEDGQISINRGDTLSGRAVISDMAAGFYAEFPDLVVLCDEIRTAGRSHLICFAIILPEVKSTRKNLRIGRSICHDEGSLQTLSNVIREIDRTVRKGLDVHLIVDNYGAQKTPAVHAWLEKHPRFSLHFTPTSASWLNLVERFFAEITTKRIRRGTFTSVADLEAAIRDYLDQHNANPKPFVWTKSADDILKREARAKDVLDAINGGYQALDSEH